MNSEIEGLSFAYPVSHLSKKSCHKLTAIRQCIIGKEAPILDKEVVLHDGY